MGVSFKLVVNRDHGGFGLSIQAIKLYNSMTKGPKVVSPKIGRGRPKGKLFDFELERNDPLLVQVVETLGCKEASGEFAHLGIVEVGVSYDIDSRDGREKVIATAWVND